MNIMNDIFWYIRNKYTKINKIDLIKTLNLNTPIIANECFIRFTKLIFEGPKYLFPRSEEMTALSLQFFANDPEKLLQVALSVNIFSMVDFVKHV